MKKIGLICFIFASISIGFAQNTYTVNGETLELKTEVEGELDLLWTVTYGKYRYFVRTSEGTITELKSTRDSNGKYKKEYLDVLKNLTSDSNVSPDRVSLTTGSLKRFIDNYNKRKDSDYKIRNTDSKVNFRLAFFGGTTNHPLVENIDNTSSFQLATELELFGDTDNPRHSGLLQARQTLGAKDDYRSTEFSLGYRFRILRKERFNLYVQNRFASVNFFSIERPVFTDETSSIIEFQTRNESEFDVPFIFGIGADIKISANSYLTILYDRFFALGLDNSDDFPMDIMVGYKFNL
ncbi:hypothetical protein DFQ05_2383 [Winogradskyella wandonensis]|uniref:Outer membrane protein with beta-barrel domain n=1 Tax=Winogradskyella wandonensis TaxID=1442586 RepID=A0A4R1KK52_9FLAO|nr:hypothetical protein [Winogradskyella wandonensis]TCK65168.1 hypothetical protein DFQ05_2383 [Winogradskyella wandonensis]